MCYNEITKTIKAQGEYIFGHLFSAVGAVISKSNRFFCIPLKINIQDGLQSAAGWEGSTGSTDFTLTSVQISCIAFGILQLLAVQEATEGDLSTLFYTRTKAKSRVSEARVRWYLIWRIDHLLLQNPDSSITKFIRERQMK